MINNIVDYCKGRCYFNLDDTRAYIDIYYKFGYSLDRFAWGVEMELTGKILSKDIKKIELALRGFLPNTSDEIIDQLIETVGYYIDEPENFKNVITKFGNLEV